MIDAYTNVYSLYLYLSYEHSPWPACVDDVSSVEWDADLLVVVDKVVLTVVGVDQQYKQPNVYTMSEKYTVI